MSPEHQALLRSAPRALRLSQGGSALPPMHSEEACKHRTTLQCWPGGEEAEMDNTGPYKRDSYPWPPSGETEQALPGLLQSPGLPSLSATVPECLLTFSSLHW